MRVYHARLVGLGAFAKADRQPSGGGVLTSPYLHDFMLNYAFYEALKSRNIVLPENPNYLEELKGFFEELPVYVFPTVIKGKQKTESLNVLPSTRSIPELGSGSNVPNWNKWLSYAEFTAETTILSNISLPTIFYIRLGKKRTPVKVRLEEKSHKVKTKKSSVGLISPIMHDGLEYVEGTVIKMNPSPLYSGIVGGEIAEYKLDNEFYSKPLQFAFLDF